MHAYNFTSLSCFSLLKPDTGAHSYLIVSKQLELYIRFTKDYIGLFIVACHRLVDIDLYDCARHYSLVDTLTVVTSNFII